MLTEKQLAANRANAQKSTGPTSAEGKRRSSLNACRHNLTGQVSAMTPEDRAAHDKFSEGIVRSLAPEGDLELQLAQRIATDSWRLNRASAIEDNLFALGLCHHAEETGDQHPEVEAAFATAKTWQAESGQIERLTLYEQRLNRAIQRNLATLKALQATRKTEREAAFKQAKKLYQASRIKGLRHDPAGSRTGGGPLCGGYEIDGFVFSSEQIHLAVDRDRRLQRLETHDFHSRKAPKPEKVQAAAA
jgi:hypothetical protein